MIFLKEIKESQLDKLGGKAKGLFHLYRNGFKVPDFFVILPSEEISSKELDKYLNDLNGDLFSVRSSALNEDGSSKSFAGQYKTFLYVKKEDVEEKIKAVRESLKDANKRGYSEESSQMAVIVQKMVDPELAGVIFTESQSSSKEIYLEVVEGVGENLVSGLKRPESFVYKKDEKPSNELHQQLLKAALSLEKKMDMPLDIEWAYKNNSLYFLQVRPLTIVDDEVPDVDISKYNLYVKHDFSLFVNSIQIEASKKEQQERLFGFSIPIIDGLLINGHEFYSDENDKVTLDVWTGLDKGDFFSSYISLIERLESKVLSHLEELKTIDPSKLSDEELRQKYKLYIKIYLDSYIPMMMRPDDYLLDKIKAISDLSDDELNKLLYVDTPTLYSKELSSFYEGIISNDFSNYLKDYEWIINPLGYDLKPLTLKYIKERAENVSKETAIKRIKESNKNKQHGIEEREQLLSKLNNQNLVLLINLLRKFVYFRTAIAETSDRFFYYFKKTIINELCKRSGVALNDALIYDYKDFETNIFENKYPSNILNKRKRGQLVWFKGETIEEYYGLKTYSLLKESLPETKYDLKGQIACPGRVKGKVKIVNNFADISKMEKGDILVTSMTTPEIAGALDKAVGIITDEGGVTCHAAIIAREYAIPCLVGTEKATKILKDNQEVILDCIKGAVAIN